MKLLAPYLAIAALGVRFPEIPEPRFLASPTTLFNPNHKTGVAASRRAARKNKRKKR